MTKEEFKELKAGDIIASKFHGQTYMVHSNYGNRVTAVRIADVTNPNEWELRLKVTHRDVRKET